MNAKKTETTKSDKRSVSYSLTAITALEFETICRGLELAQNEPDETSIRAFNMLRRLDDLREKERVNK